MIAAPVWIRSRYTIHQAHDSLDDIINVGELALHAAMIEYLDRLVSNIARVNKQSHIGPSPRAIHGEKTQTRRRQAEQMAIAVSQKLVRLLSRTINADGMINILVYRERHFRQCSIHRARRRIY